MSEDDSGGGGFLARAGATFEEALGAMPAKDKYNAVLMSLLSGGQQNAGKALDLVAEMSSKRLILSNDALKALLDSAVEAGNADAILESLRAARGNGACRSFGTPQLTLPAKPSDGALATLPELPQDSRSNEVGAAAGFTLVVGGVLAAEFVDFIDFSDGILSAPPLQLVFLALAGGWAFDRYARGGDFFALIGRGLSRLFSRDLQRECALESASFLIGYLLGLPCCPFAPTVYKPLDMLTASGAGMEADVRASTLLLAHTHAPPSLRASNFFLFVGCLRNNERHG